MFFSAEGSNAVMQILMNTNINSNTVSEPAKLGMVDL